MVILGMLTFVLFSAYNKVSEISFRIERQRKVNEEVLFLSEILQNYANRNSIDFGKYETELHYASWFTDILYLSWEDGQFSIYSTWTCMKIGDNTFNDLSEYESWCAFYMKKWDSEPVKLTNDWVYFSEAKFKIIPYFESYFDVNSSAVCDTNYFSCVNDDWFRLFVDVYPKGYSKAIWANNIHLFVQQFFNIY